MTVCLIYENIFYITFSGYLLESATLYFAHTKGDNKEEWQTIEAHCKNVSQECAARASQFGAQNLGKIIGLHHDIGKYSAKFQKRLEGSKNRVIHSTAGALELLKYNNFIARLLAYTVIGHHSGLPDTGNKYDDASFVSRIKNDEVCDYSAYKKDFPSIEPDFELDERFKDVEDEIYQFSLSFLMRMLFSCLIDSDYLDTETAREGKNAFRGDYDSLQTLFEKFNLYMKNMKTSENEINSYRKILFEQCMAKAQMPKGFYSLTIPTGGGKTLISTGFALEHALKNNQRRIIYTLPLTSIIEQNAEVLRQIFGEKNVLEHHSNYVFEEDEKKFKNIKILEALYENEENTKRLTAASENWDIPFILTTDVMFFESLFSNKPSRCRKLCNIVGSVIIIDEAQKLPLWHQTPILRALELLVKQYNCTVIFCTATQPGIPKGHDLKIHEIVSEPQKWNELFKRVKISDIRKYTDEELAQKLSTHKSVLTVVNTKKHALNLYRKLKEKSVPGEVFHLSTFMCPIHRKKVIKTIKERLNAGLNTKVVSTQLIEAGVDISFPYVYRSLSGIDSIIQAAGRCNRNGEAKLGKVNVFVSQEDYARSKGYLSCCEAAADYVFDKHDDILSLEAIKYYFEKLRGIERNSDKGKIMEKFEFYRGGDEQFQFKTAANEFKFIETNTHTVIVPYDEHAQKLLEEALIMLKTQKRRVNAILRKLQPYTIQLFENCYTKLRASGVINEKEELKVLTMNPLTYNEETGIVLDENNDELLMI